MRTRDRFGFLLGLLVGTATVGSVSLMMGQSDAPPARDTIFEVSHSPDGSVVYLWGIEPRRGTLRLVRQQPMPERGEEKVLGESRFTD